MFKLDDLFGSQWNTFFLTSLYLLIQYGPLGRVKLLSQVTARRIPYVFLNSPVLQSLLMCQTLPQAEDKSIRILIYIIQNQGSQGVIALSL